MVLCRNTNIYIEESGAILPQQNKEALEGPFYHAVYLYRMHDGSPGNCLKMILRRL